MAQRKLFNASDVEIAKAWRSYYAQYFVIKAYPLKNKEQNRMVEDLLDGLYDAAYDASTRAKYEAIFKEAQSLAIQKIKSFQFLKEQEKEAIERIQSINIYWKKKFKNSKFKKIPLELFSWGIAYDPDANQINMGLEGLAYSNSANIFSVFAHEIGHSIDSCRWGYYLKSKDPFEKLQACIRKKDGLNAKKRDDRILEKLFKEKKIPINSYTMFKVHNTCNKSFYPPRGIQADQYPETFADWFSAELVALSKYKSEPFRVDLCAKHKLLKGSSYLSNEDRLHKIYFSHPVLKKEYPSSKSIAYCSIR